MKPATPLGDAVIIAPGVTKKIEAYRKACKASADLAAARTKCRDAIDVALKAAPDDANVLAQAMIEVGAAASRDLGDPSATAFLLGHLSRRIRESAYFDF